MGLRFRRSIKLLPGLRLNLGLGSISFSTGTRGFWFTKGLAANGSLRAFLAPVCSSLNG
jgi:hypothetical protein